MNFIQILKLIKTKKLKITKQGEFTLNQVGTLTLKQKLNETRRNKK